MQLRTMHYAALPLTRYGGRKRPPTVVWRPGAGVARTGPAGRRAAIARGAV